MTNKLKLASATFLAAFLNVSCAAGSDQASPPPAPALAPAGQASHSQPPPPFQFPALPDKPAEIADFFTKAKAADNIADPLARCLAYPDIPGNHWPAGLTETHCRLQFGPHIKKDDIRKYLSRGDTRGLDALFAKDLARHFSKSDFSEVIHADFSEILADSDTDQLTTQWLKLAPGSAYALLARARYLRAMAGHARGNGYASETPAESMQKMSELAGQAIELSQQALKIEPKLMPAYGLLIKLGTMDSRSDIVADAVKESAAIDPDCYLISVDIMMALEPRWGGSYEAMTAYAQRLSKDVARRPLLATTVSMKDVDLSDVMYDHERYSDSLQILLPAALQSTNPEIFQDLARAMQQVDRSKYIWEAPMYLLEASRFIPQPDDWVIYSFGERQPAIDIEWSATLLERYSALNPDDAQLHFMLGYDYMFLRKPDDASKQLLISANDPKFRQSSLLALIGIEAQRGRTDQAGAYFDTLNSEFPAFAQQMGFKDPRIKNRTDSAHGAEPKNKPN
jgi:tetratricopeptide (TPR) repeat protein